MLFTQLLQKRVLAMFAAMSKNVIRERVSNSEQSWGSSFLFCNLLIDMNEIITVLYFIPRNFHNIVSSQTCYSYQGSVNRSNIMYIYPTPPHEQDATKGQLLS